MKSCPELGDENLGPLPKAETAPVEPDFVAEQREGVDDSVYELQCSPIARMFALELVDEGGKGAIEKLDIER